MQEGFFKITMKRQIANAMQLFPLLATSLLGCGVPFRLLEFMP
jgi:hypothetical protein